MSDVAYGKRNIKAIKRREKINYLYKGIKILQRKILNYDKRQIKTIATYPFIDNENKLIEIANKLAWAFPKKNDLIIYITVSKELLNLDLKKVDKIPNQRNYLKNIDHIILTDKFYSNADLILYTDAKAILTSNPFKLYKTEILDKNYFSEVESDFLKKSFYKTFSEREKQYLKEISVKNFKNLLKLNKNKAYCFVTGPSFDNYKNFNYEKNSLKVICNSIVKNDEFLEFINGPDILTFADPVFHFSPSEYSAVFRDEVLKVYYKYKPYIIVPEATVGLLLAHYPVLKDRIIGMKTKKGNFNFPSLEKFWVKGSSNILTLYMLPIASSISDEINIIGADGRNPNEKYFWKHSSSAQFNDLMKTVFETHPSFFRDRDYKDYYKKHCDFLEELIRFGEQQGKQYYSLTKSFIPILKEKFLK